MKTLLLLIGALLSSATACESIAVRAKCEIEVAGALAFAEAAEPAKQPAPQVPASPAPKRPEKERGKRPALPAHLFM